jgi:membrane-bound serine protease (ClpP class)
MPVGPNTAFVILLAGIGGIYWELVHPGRVIPGAAGIAAAITGACFLFRPPLETPGLFLLVSGIAFLAAEAFWGPPLVLGTIGTIALTAGFALLLPPPRRLVPQLAVPVSAVFGLVTALLASIAKRARRNKWADIEPQK